MVKLWVERNSWVIKECLAAVEKHMTFRDGVWSPLTSSSSLLWHDKGFAALIISGNLRGYGTIAGGKRLVSNKRMFHWDEENIQFLGMGHGAHPLPLSFSSSAQYYSVVALTGWSQWWWVTWVYPSLIARNEVKGRVRPKGADKEGRKPSLSCSVSLLGLLMQGRGCRVHHYCCST